jgi:hypothetical protein
MKTIVRIVGLGINKRSLIHDVSVINILFPFRIKLKKREWATTDLINTYPNGTIPSKDFIKFFN